MNSISFSTLPPYQTPSKMRYESTRNLIATLKELSDISKNKLIELQLIFEREIPTDGRSISSSDNKAQAVLEIINILLKYAT